MAALRALLVALAVGTLALTSVSAQVVVRTFDQDARGAAPSGFIFATARQQSAAAWVVRADDANQYLTHVLDPDAVGGLSLALLQSPHPTRMRASARVKLLEGEQIGGLVWRYESADNFYMVALDLRLQAIALYRVVRGNRIRLEVEDDLDLDPTAWHSLRVVHDDDRIRVALGGIGVMRARDRAFAGTGRAGVWAGGGATAWFDDLRVEEDEERRR